MEDGRYKFQFLGGVSSPNPGIQRTQALETKFMLFFLVGGTEVPHYQMERSNLLFRDLGKEDGYEALHPLVKIFISCRGFDRSGINRIHSFFFRMEKEIDHVKSVLVRPFPESDAPFYFRAKGGFLSNKEALELLDEKSVSRAYLKRQKMLPVETLRKMITISRAGMKKGVRHIRIPKSEL